MNDTEPLQKQDIDRLYSVLERIDQKLGRLVLILEWATRDDPPEPKIVAT